MHKIVFWHLCNDSKRAIRLKTVRKVPKTKCIQCAIPSGKHLNSKRFIFQHETDPKLTPSAVKKNIPGPNSRQWRTIMDRLANIPYHLYRALCKRKSTSKEDL